MQEALQQTREDLESRVEARFPGGNDYGLTFREMTVLQLVVSGRADKEIGQALGISTTTVHKHVASILDKMAPARAPRPASERSARASSSSSRCDPLRDALSCARTFVLLGRAVQRVILHVDLDAFFVAVEQARDRPCGASRSSSAAIPAGAASSPRPRTRRASSASIRRCRSAPPSDSARTRSSCAATIASTHGCLAPFIAILAEFSPLVEPGGLDEAYLDVTGCGPVIESTDRVRCDDAGRARARRGRSDPQSREGTELSLNASVGVASGRSTAKIASDAAKPDGLLVVPFGGRSGVPRAAPGPRPSRPRREGGRRADAAGRAHAGPARRSAGCV